MRTAKEIKTNSLQFPNGDILVATQGHNAGKRFLIIHKPDRFGNSNISKYTREEMQFIYGGPYKINIPNLNTAKIGKA